MNALENMHDVRFPKIYILFTYNLYIIYYILPFTIIVDLVIKGVGFSKVSNIFAMHCGDTKD